MVQIVVNTESQAKDLKSGCYHYSRPDLGDPIKFIGKREFSIALKTTD